jgi:NADPH:quinone reductase
MTSTQGTTTSDPTSTRWVIDRFGAPADMRLSQREPLPVPKSGEVRIRVEASSVQFTDTIVRRGRYPDAGKPPLTPGYDLVGYIDAVGDGVSDWRCGDRVADMSVIGANATHVLRPASGLTRVPAALDAAEATAVILSGVTAYQMLFRQVKLQGGARVLIQGGNGGVGFPAVQLACRAGLRVWTTARRDHHAQLAALGASPLDYSDPAYPAQLRAETDGGVDVVFDGIGADCFRPSLTSLRSGGKLVFIGTSEAVNQGKSMIGTGAKLLARNLLPWSPRISLYSVSTMRTRQPQWFREDLRKLFELLAQRALVVRIERRIGFDGVPEAHAALERGGVSGKIVLMPDHDFA